MKNRYLIPLVCCALLLSAALPARSQDLQGSRTDSPVGLVYKLSLKQAAKVASSKKADVDMLGLTDPWTTFLTDSGLQDLPYGQYLVAKSVKDRLKTEFRTVNHCEAKVLNNQNDLVLKVYDDQGRPVTTADVFVDGARVSYDTKSETYLKRKSNKKGLLRVSFNGHTSFFNLERQYNNSGLKRAYRKVVFGTPLKYVARPVLFVIYVPIDLVRSVVKLRPVGTIYTISHPFGNYYDFFEKIGCLFDRSYCDVDDKYNGYLVTDKPKYRPGDTVRVKALIQKKNGKPVTTPLKLIVNSWYSKKEKDLGWVYPTERGTYITEFLLHDSLDLPLDKQIPLSLEDEYHRNWRDGFFTYEEYELNNLSFKARSVEKSHTRSDTSVVYLSATDDNNLPVPDGSVYITVTPERVLEYFSDTAFVPDTLWKHSLPLDPVGETKVVLPDSIFPNVSLAYKIHCRLQSSDGKTREQALQHTLTGRPYIISVEENDNMLTIAGKLGEEEVSRPATLMAFYGSSKVPADTLQVMLPAQLNVGPVLREVRILSEGASRTFQTSSLTSQVEVGAVRTADSLFVSVENPRRLFFNWQLYYKNNKVAEGRDTTLTLTRKPKGKDNYFFALQYVWANQATTESYVIDFKSKQLDIQIDAPSVIVPGDEKEITVTVKDAWGQPVENADLLAYGLTSKFEPYRTPEAPDYNPRGTQRKLINEFNRRNLEGVYTEKFLDHDRWKQGLGIDSVEFYRFLFPGERAYTAVTETPDGSTQFAPFVIDNGRPVAVHVVLVDHRPVYFSWALQNRYAFPIDSGQHTVRLRTAEKEFVLNDFYFEKGKKTVISIPWDFSDSTVAAWKRKDRLSKYQTRNYYSYLIKLRQSENRLAYLKSGNRVFMSEGNGTNLVGPIYGNRFDFHDPENFSLTGIEKEPFFSYEIKPQMAKLTHYKSYPRKQKLSMYSYLKGHCDFVLREPDILEMVRRRKIDLLRNYRTYDKARTDKLYTGKLQVAHDTVTAKVKGPPLFNFLRRMDDLTVFDAFPGTSTDFPLLAPGPWQLIAFFSDSTYGMTDTLLVRPGGTNFYRMDSLVVHQADTFWHKTMDYLLERAAGAYRGDYYYRQVRVDPKPIQEYYYNQHLFTEGNVAWGVVTDETGGPLPGTTVMVKGTTIGTVTDINGAYTLNVPDGNYTLVISFIGYATQEIRAAGSQRVDGYMIADVTQLSEIVVVGYGSVARSSLTGSVATVHNGLMGRAPGAVISDSAGNAHIMIRGASSGISLNNPLYIIDGVPYTGDISKLKPEMIENLELLRDESLTAIYGSRAVNGVIMITTKGTATFSIPTLTSGKDDDTLLFPQGMENASSLRSNFSDAAFWRPALVTDRNGRASFRAVFPDDITRWDVHVIGVKRKFTGTGKGSVRAFKPLSAQLALPRFLTEGDSAVIIGKTMNYTHDSVRVQTHFSLNGRDTAVRRFSVLHSVVDSLQLAGLHGGDTVKVRYMLNGSDGYFDGEERELPVVPLGTVKRTGDLVLLDSDTSFTVPAKAGKGPVFITATASFSEALVKQAERLVDYRYDCNEQLASKLLAHLALEKLGVKETGRRDVKELINQLLNNQNSEEMWGWWNKSAHSGYWITEHVIYALREAEKSGYNVPVKTGKAVDNLLYEFGLAPHEQKTGLLALLFLLDRKINLSSYIKEAVPMDSASLYDELRHLQLSSAVDKEKLQALLAPYRKTTYFGNYYWTDTNASMRSITRSDYSITLLVIHLLSKAGMEKEMEKAVNYFIEEMDDGYWANTYEASKIIYALASDMEGSVDPETKDAGLVIEAGGERVVPAEYPFEGAYEETADIKIQKTGNERVFLLWYQEEHVKETAPYARYFDIDTEFFEKGTGRKVSAFKKGERITVRATFEVKDNEDYLMVEIPIPAGCSYGVKPQTFGNSHREYFKEKVAVFYEKISKGKHTVEFELVPRFSGSYHVNPARAELMYFPVVYGVNGGKKIKIGGN